jgi:hypothetical protein
MMPMMRFFSLLIRGVLVVALGLYITFRLANLDASQALLDIAIISIGITLLVLILKAIRNRAPEAETPIPMFVPNDQDKFPADIDLIKSLEKQGFQFDTPEPTRWKPEDRNLI